GRVYNYPGLHIADGSVMPGPVGANPSLTIAGLADRFADAILEDMKGPTVTAPPPKDSDVPAGAADAAEATPRPPASEKPASLEFTEKMRGFITFGEDDFDKGFRKGKKEGTALMFHLTVHMDDMERFVKDEQHPGTITGHVQCDALGGELQVLQGWFNLFVEDGRHGERKLMKYRLFLQDGEGHPITLRGFKEVENDPGFDLWPDTSTLFTYIYAGHVEPDGDDDAEIVASGVLHIRPTDFAVQMTTLRVNPPHRVDAIGRFGALFAGDLWEVYAKKYDR
ncbi:MAG TPA: GMC oxidoreductase, partial [Solirubrobacteraceae bacterium]|nr:GMC oxidoreductase [Solirubrobacteraceae bacterium]